MSKLPSWYDSWKTHDASLEEADPEICKVCGELQELEVDVDVDEETGRPYACGGSWSCVNENCGKQQ